MPVQGQLTIKHVAQAAGVSTQTVSRVLNDRPDVSPETRQRVQEVITELGYQPSAIARSLSRQRSLTLGVVIAELGQYGPTRRLIGMKEAADELGYSLRLSLEPQPEITDGEQIIAELLSWQVDGIIWAVPEVGGTRAWLLQKIADVTVPIVFISEQPLYNEPPSPLITGPGGIWLPAI
jgi:DNA-binding LacI/PurR family transcriptional regulator